MRLRLYKLVIVCRLVFSLEIYRAATFDFCNTIGGKADIGRPRCWWGSDANHPEADIQGWIAAPRPLSACWFVQIRCSVLSAETKNDAALAPSKAIQAI